MDDRKGVPTAAEADHQIDTSATNGINVPDLPRLGPTITVDDGHKKEYTFAQFQRYSRAHRKRTAYTSTVDWHRWRHDNWKPSGRVLVIDYSFKDNEFKSFSKEFHEVDGLRRFYDDSRQTKKPMLRLVHVQNAFWATRFLMHKYNIDNRDDLVGTDFAKWARFDKPEWRAGRPHLKGKTWRTQRDPWRGIRRTAFGADYLKAYSVRGGHRPADDAERNDHKMMELNSYDETDNPAYSYDTIVQRLSCYIQHADGDPTLPTDDIRNPYAQHTENERRDSEMRSKGPRYRPRTHFPPLEELDNGNAVIVFESSYSGSVEDTLIQARNQIESRWRRLQFYLRRDELTSNDRVALECINLILADVFKGLNVNWDNFLGICETHVSILEDKIYQSPADESRAPELWANSSSWLRVEKLMSIHLDIVREMVGHLEDLPSDDNSLEEWITNTYESFQRLSNLVQEDLIKPTTNLNDLLYKSVEIRDSRHSIRLGTSMWRLSWITFIFLPLTFLVSFFGMNVDTFQGLPSIKWYFISAVPLMLLVLCAWYSVKHYLASQQRTPYQRGVYEHLFRDLAINHPDMWTRGGPREHIRPTNFSSRIKWRLLSRWFSPERTVRRVPADPDEDAGSSDLGAYARFKRRCARKWLGEISISRPGTPSALEDGDGDGVPANAVTELLEYSAPVTVAQAEPSSHPLTRFNLEQLHPHSGDRRRSSASEDGRRVSSDGASSAPMVEERIVTNDKDPEPEREEQGYVKKSLDGVMDLFGVGYSYGRETGD